MIVFVKDEDEEEFVRLMRNESSSRYFNAFRTNKYHIMDRDYDLVKHIAKRCRA